LESLKPEYIASYITNILDNPISVDSSQVSAIYSWDAKAREIEQVYEFAKKNYLL